jgi:hypothetical protein
MLDLIFYITDMMQPKYIEISEDLYEWLARSHFSKIGRSIEQQIEIDGETEQLPVVELDKVSGNANSTNKSISLFSPASSRATDPNNAKDATPKFCRVSRRSRNLDQIRSRCIIFTLNYIDSIIYSLEEKQSFFRFSTAL